MEVRDLIKILQTMDPDAMVLVGDYESCANDVTDVVKDTITMVDDQGTIRNVAVIYCETETFWELDEKEKK